ncbi:MAG: biotin synthase BioB [Francisellaceae bacterium]
MTRHEAKTLYDLPFMELIDKARAVHRQYFKPEIELCTLLSIKTGACPEDCKYCPQSGHYKTAVEKEKLMSKEVILLHAKKAKALGAKRFCMGAAWKNPPASAMPKMVEIIKSVKELGLETCVTLGMLDDEKTAMLKGAGLDYYNHNIDTSKEYYGEIISTRTFEDRIDTLERVAKAGMKVCSGGILGMGETTEDRLSMLVTLANLQYPPQSVPINKLVPVPGTPLGDGNVKPVNNFEFIRMIAVARLLMPKAKVRLSAGRSTMTQEMQTLCFMAGANSIFYGDKLLTTENPVADQDLALFENLGLNIERSIHETESA